MNITNQLKAKQERKGWSLFLIFAMALTMLAGDLFAQDYELSLKQRRMGNQIGVEVWVKSLSSSAPELGNMSVAVNYNTDYLQPASMTTAQIYMTDSVDYDPDQSGGTLPYRTITSPFYLGGGYDYSDPQVQAANIGGTYVFQLDVKFPIAGANAFQPTTDNIGTFAGMMIFDIIDYENLADATTTMIDFNTSTVVGDFRIFDKDGNDMEATTSLVSPPAMTIRGITILNPQGPNEAVNRNKTYPNMDVAGYPVYFERSGLINPTEVDSAYGTSRLAYSVDFSTNNGSSWTNGIFLFAETKDEEGDLAPNEDKYRFGEISTSDGTSSGYIVTQGDGTQLPVPVVPGYGGVLRVMWEADQFFAPRSEQALLRMRQMSFVNTEVASDLDDRDIDNDAIADTSDLAFVLSRLFFAQLDGTSNYFKTRDKFSNPHALTVEAWINLNSIQTADGAQPGIVAQGPGGTEPNEEGAWILYLDEGKYPAFRCKEMFGGEGRGENGSDYLATVVSPDALSTTSDAVPINDNASHPDNWTHIAATVSNNVVSLYVDGELKARTINENASDIRMATLIHPVWVGVNPIGGISAEDYLHAGIKEVRVWRSSIEQDTIRENASGVPNPETYTDPDIRSSLELYYSFVGSNNDLAAANRIQNYDNPINYYTTSGPYDSPSTDVPNYRPDRAHIRLTSPVGGEGARNTEDAAFQVRWVGYGLGDADNTGTSDVVIEFQRDGFSTWVTAIDNQTPGELLSTLDLEDTKANWEPYKHASIVGTYNDLQAIVPEESEFAKTVQLRIRGTEANNQNDILSQSADFTVAPYFAIRNTGNSKVVVPNSTTMNISGSAALLEAWIRPYRFPTAEEVYFPIINKKDTLEGGMGHYAFRLLSTGQLQLEITESDGTVQTATSDINRPLVAPNFDVYDSTWYYVAVFANLGNGTGQTSTKFYVDGNVQSADSIAQQLGSDVSVDNTNEYPTFIGYEQGVDEASNRYFIGEMKEVRFWNGVPASQTITGAEPTDLTKFIQGAANVRAEDLLTSPTNYRQNLKASFTNNGGGFVRDHAVYNGIYSSINGVWAQIIADDNYDYEAVTPLVKLVEPTTNDTIPNTTTDLKVRWVGFDYDNSDFFTGDAVTADTSDLEFSTIGGGGVIIQPYNATASEVDDAAFTNSFSLPVGQDAYMFEGTAPPFVQFAGELNVSIADGTSGTQEPIAASKLNARLRMKGRTTTNSESPLEYTDIASLRNEGPVFTITPPSNFTVRVLLEGFQQGSNTATTDIGSSFATNGLKISLYEDNGGQPGTLVATGESLSGYSSDAGYDPLDPNGPPARMTAGSRFANVPFIFTDVIDGSYYVVVEHNNHLPVMSRYPAPFIFSGDDFSTMDIESGWDFQNWDGLSTNVLEEDDVTGAVPTIGTKYTAYGYSETDPDLTDYGATGLIFNEGESGADGNNLAAMVGGDAERDGKINAADRVKVRFDASGYTYNSDINGDGNVNGTDRQIVDRNSNKTSSIADLFPSMFSSFGTPDMPAGEMQEYDPYNVISSLDPRLSSRMNEAAKELDEGKQDTYVYETLAEGGLKYRVSGQTILDEENNQVRVAIYLQNIGGDFALANCTFAIEFNANALEFNSLQDIEMSPWSNIPDKGYVGESYSAPKPDAINKIPNVRTIEIDYDNYAQKSGSLVPNARTLVGTLVFDIKVSEADYEFEWYKSSVIHRTDGRNVTSEGIFDKINSVSTVLFANLITPNGGESLRPGRTYSVSWTQPTENHIVHVEFSADNGNSWNRVTTEPIDINDLNYSWVTPDANSEECLIRLVDANAEVELDRSDNIFKLIPAPAYITRPSASDDVYAGGAIDQIKWVVEDVENVMFKFSENGTGNWIDVTASTNALTGATEWNIPVVNSKEAVVAMHDAETGALVAVSEPFRVLAGGLDFITPTEDELLKHDMATSVRWNSNNVANFDLQLSVNGGGSWTTIETSVNALKHTYSWMVPNVKTDNAYLRAIWDGDEDMVYDVSDRFSIDGVTGVAGEELEGIIVENAYPNPFGDETKIFFRTEKSEIVTVDVFNAAGVKVMTPYEAREFGAGYQSITINAHDLSSGVYYVRFTFGTQTITKEIAVVK